MCTATPRDGRLEGDLGVSGQLNVRRLRVEDTASLVSLRREALETDPMAVGSSIADDRGLSLELVRTLWRTMRNRQCLAASRETTSEAWSG
jgi:hypothetical protein